MRRDWRVIGVVAAMLGWVPAAEAGTVARPPGDPAGWVIEKADYTGEIQDRIARFEVRYTIRVMADGWTEIPMALQGATINDITLEKRAGEAHLLPRDGSYVLAATRKGQYKVRVTFATLLKQDSQSEGIHLQIPRATFSTATLFVPRKDVELRPEDQLYVERTPEPQRGGVKLTARVGAADRIAVSWRTKPADPEKVEPVLYGEVSTLVNLEEQLARLTAIIDYRIAQGETKALRIRVPGGVNVLNVRGSGIEEWRLSDDGDHKSLNVTLHTALKDTTYRLIVEGEQIIGKDDTTYTLPAFQLTDVKQERGYLAVGRTGSIELAPESAEGINRVDVRELPELLSTAGTPAILAFKYHQHPYRATLSLTRHEDHPVLAAIAEQAELASVLSRQGELLTRAVYLIRANKKQFVEVLLPEGASLWSCLVNHRSVKPVEGKEQRLMIPLDAVGESAETVKVELVYFERRPVFTGVGRMTLQGPVLDVPTTVTNWELYAPKDVRFIRLGGNLERGTATGGFLDEPWTQVAMAAEAPQGASFLKEGGAGGELVGAANRLLDGHKRGLRRAGESFDGRSEEGVDGGAAGGLRAGFSRDDFKDKIDGLAKLQEAGILPLKIRLPNAGTIYRFNRLMTSGEALTLDGMFVHVRMPMALGALGLILLPLGAFAATRLPLRRS